MNFFEKLHNVDNDLNAIAGEYLDLQITCMLLYHAGRLKIKDGDVKNGEIILDFTAELRESVKTLWNTCETLLGREEMGKTFARIGHKEMLYHALSDEVIASNAEYLPTAPRPPGMQYACNEALCNQTIDALLHQYFSPLWDENI